MTDEKTIRAFLALDHPEAVGRTIAAAQDRLKKCIHGEIRWVRPEGIHLTLKFFGDIPQNAVAEIAAVVEKKAVETQPFALAIGGMGVFPDPHRPRVLWLGMKGELERLLGFQQTLERALQEIGFPSEERPFRPHLTLGRIRPSGPRGLAGLDKALEKDGETAGGEFLAAGISLMQSTLTPQGAIYTRLGGFPLAGLNGR
jgi:2'-5' RNA ligase